MVSVNKIDVKDTYALRLEVLRKNIDLPYEFDGDLDDTTFHVGVIENGNVVCIGTFMKNSLKELNGIQYQLRGMASSSEVRGKGYGKLLLKFATNELLKLKVKFYEKNQFEIIGDRFENKAGPHYKMFKTIKYE
ncbi:MAG: GNAT family N-acetyltransferase [Tenacibaculum sp.]|nr:GNAT family N-acetyltransferase [Tenacibaculum sp.]